ncbi:MAG: phosphate acyltransferase PlsX [Gammaproteobacteria bacterium]
MATPVTIAIDAMSGDHGLHTTVPAALAALAEFPQLHLLLVGDQAQIRAALGSPQAGLAARLGIEHASEVVGMDEPPSKALRNKKDSSMRVAINRVKEGRAQAAISAGNTGALMATARFVLKTLPGIDRPAIVSSIPAANGHIHMLDLGANVECSAEHLFQFALMGAALVTALEGVERPRIALLNIGAEEIKGNDTIKQAAALIQASSLNYAGFVEGDGIFFADVDVVVADGFAGNIALKTGEGVAKLITHFMREAFGRNPFTRLAALAALPVLRVLGRRIDPRLHNGATFLGLNGIVIKSHGGADVLAFTNAIRVAVREVEHDVPSRISRLIPAVAPVPATTPGTPPA